MKTYDDIVLGSLVADKYALGTHWIYDETQLKDIDIDWDDLSAPRAMWHKGKKRGDFTHYGDQTALLYNYLKERSIFNASEYFMVWYNYMKQYDGYMDSATKDTIKKFEESGKKLYSGSNSHDLSIAGRIAPLLLVSEDLDDFLENVEIFTSLTHNNELAYESSNFFGNLLYMTINGNNIKDSIIELSNLGYSKELKGYIKQAFERVELDSFSVIREFGPACGAESGFGGVIHTLIKYENFKDAMVANAQAGGDSSARGMIIAMILVASQGKVVIPSTWIENMNFKM